MWREQKKKQMKLSARRKRKRRTNNSSIHNSKARRKNRGSNWKTKARIFWSLIKNDIRFGDYHAQLASITALIIGRKNRLGVWFEWLDTPFHGACSFSPSFCVFFLLLSRMSGHFLPLWWGGHFVLHLQPDSSMHNDSASNWIDSVKCRIVMHIRAHSLTIRPSF